jgi:Fe-S-cluster-containing hydrogenase component 2
MIIVNQKKCPEDHVCPMIRHCPTKAISQEGFKAPKVDTKKCIECMFCVNHCPHDVFEKS